jgi:hypothetical protein
MNIVDYVSVEGRYHNFVEIMLKQWMAMTLKRKDNKWESEIIVEAERNPAVASTEIEKHVQLLPQSKTWRLHQMKNLKIY